MIDGIFIVSESLSIVLEYGRDKWKFKMMR